ncbi:hypothetical protein RHGRI_002191 [Rhododendron griersonianum]|uniref:Uncharacterized protein n=1 Tax=Rhododendron griersonianum TaxID=479676 RepID=A0AAV6LNW7_9ERIC|nr:hypothetical protein RHGRI_002191 [Rhododendron griersonianum]
MHYSPPDRIDPDLEHGELIGGDLKCQGLVDDVLGALDSQAFADGDDAAREVAAEGSLNQNSLPYLRMNLQRRQQRKDVGSSVEPERLNKSAALHMNINAAKGLQDVLKTNLGPKGTIKILFLGYRKLKAFLCLQQIQNPIARTAVAQDDISGDGTTSTVLFIGELMKQSERYIDEGMHPRVLVDGFEIAKRATLQYLEKFKTPVVMGDEPDKEILKMVARTTLRTKLYEALADQLTDIVVNAVLCIWNPEEAIDLFMVEIMHMRHKFDVDTRLVGKNFSSVLTNMPGAILSEVNAGLFYSSVEQREAMVAAERHSVDERVKKIIELKNKVCSGNDNNFVIINQKGIDPPSLGPSCKGRGPNDHTIAQIKDSVRAGLRAVKNTIEDESVVLGAGAFEVAARQYLVNERAQLGVEAFADALLVVPKTLAENSGLDTQDVIIALTNLSFLFPAGCGLEVRAPVDLSKEPGHPFSYDAMEREVPTTAYRLAPAASALRPVIASQLLLVDEVIRSGRNMRKPT